jgi:GNAT superfamily N-acetyltransferase
MQPGNAHSASPIIRTRRDSDIPGAAIGLVEVHAKDGYPVEGVDQPTTWLTPPSLIKSWVAELDGRIVGHVSLTRPNGEDAVSLWLNRGQGTEEETAVLARLFVIPDARKMAVGERLVHTATDYATERNMRLVLDVMAKDAAAIRLYERLGWERLGVTTHTYGEECQTAAICYVSPAPRAD